MIPTDTPVTMPQPDLIVVPGTQNPVPVLSDEVLIGWLRTAAPAGSASDRPSIVAPSCLPSRSCRSVSHTPSATASTVLVAKASGALTVNAVDDAG